jgi:hypothetical protein
VAEDIEEVAQEERDEAYGNVFGYVVEHGKRERYRLHHEETEP